MFYSYNDTHSACLAVVLWRCVVEGCAFTCDCNIMALSMHGGMSTCVCLNPCSCIYVCGASPTTLSSIGRSELA